MRRDRAVVGFWAVVTASVAGLLAGCGDGKSGASESDGASASEGGSGGSTEPTGASGTPTEGSGSVSATEGDDAGSMSASMSGTTEISGGMSASMSGSEDSGDESTSTTTSGTTGMVSGSGETSASSSSTGEAIDCTLLGTEAECVAADCMAIVARPFFDDGAIWCLEAPSFLACAPQIGCDDVILTACKGQTKYQFPSSCLAPGFEVCAAPPDAGMDGYPDCA